MKTAKITLAACLIAVLCLLARNSSRAADPTDSSKDSNANHNQGGMKPPEGTPASYNKASNIIGMEVKNPNDEHMGHVKDIVFDLKSGRVSYVVMTTAPKDLPDFKEKLLAIPLNALMISPDETYFILKTDKTRVNAAAGFDDHNWPNMSNQNWSTVQFWDKIADSQH